MTRINLNIEDDPEEIDIIINDPRGIESALAILDRYIHAHVPQRKLIVINQKSLSPDGDT